jgi:hypothetical protein
MCIHTVLYTKTEWLTNTLKLVSKTKAPNVILQHHTIHHSTIQQMYSSNVPAVNKNSHGTLKQNPYRFDYCKVKVPHNRLEGPEGGRGIALLFLELSAKRGWVISTTPRPLYPQERPGTHCTGGWVRPRASLNMCKKSHPHRESIPGLSSPLPVAIPTELSWPLL